MSTEWLGMLSGQLVRPSVTTANQSSTYYNYTADRAVDGEPSRLSLLSESCSHTDISQKEAWLTIDLGRVYNVNHVKFWYRNDRGSKIANTLRLHFFQVRYTTELNNWSACYRDQTNYDTPIAMPAVIDCPHKARYIQIYSDRPNPYNNGNVFLEICEVEIYGCEVNRFGTDCLECGIRCTDCDVNNGCQKCSARFSGQHCQQCSPGYMGEDCDKVCANGQYGQNCTGRCSSNCVDGACDHVDGRCVQGCNPGYQGTTCSNECRPGFYGSGCSSQCSGNCLGSSTCDPVTGICPAGCVEAWYGPRCMKVNATSADSLTSGPADSFDILVYVGIGIGAFLIIFVLACVWFCRKKRSARPKHENEVYFKGLESGDIVVENSKPVEQVDSNSGSISITDLASVIASKSKNDYEEMKKEYQSLCYGEDSHIPCTFGKLPGNLAKNRFRTTFPYDHSRVVLTNEDNDYINANFIQNTKNEKAYIAAQGPKPNTVEDHWGMVWQENIHVIVMLTNIMDGMKPKCEKYWPDHDQEMVSGRLRISLKQEKRYASYVMRRLSLSHAELNISRDVTHFQYTQWPDHGVSDTLSLVVFHMHVMRFQDRFNNFPLLVHCSAGLGRTGTFIALDALHRHGLETGVVNVEHFVRLMRRDRMNMVQNLDQYIELYNALLESFNGISDVILSKDKFMNDIKILQNPKNTSPIWLKTQYEKLMSIRKSKNDIENTDETVDYTDKNNPQDTATGRYRAILTSHVEGRDSYYDAVILSSFTDRDYLIAGEYPLPGSSIDLCRLLVDYESAIVVFVNGLSEIQSSNEWFSDKKKTLPPYEIYREETTSVTKSIQKHRFGISHLKEDWWHTVHIYEILSWSIKDHLPSDLSIISDVIMNIQAGNQQKSHIKTPITFLSKDGVTGCGVFCAVYNAIQQLQQDEEVDMFTIVRQLLVRNQELITTLEEYRVCFVATLDVLSKLPNITYSKECVYANTSL
uniref:protein-tyrosine-phosphatase n=1 Tax=Crassostrea virginica TaxID=6565 RepID=A0A8B8BZD1_CRAVI|nr:receptor-type tyrosine-protein phosphatase C-like [Crassostrea virginica]